MDISATPRSRKGTGVDAMEERGVDAMSDGVSYEISDGVGAGDSAV